MSPFRLIRTVVLLALLAAVGAYALDLNGARHWTNDKYDELWHKQVADPLDEFVNKGEPTPSPSKR